MAGAASPESPSGREDVGAGEESSPELRELPEKELLEKSRRMQATLGVAPRLPDCGVKYRRLLDAVHREIARRREARAAAKAVDGEKCERVVRSRHAESSDLAKSDFAFTFREVDKAGDDVSRLEITSTSPCSPKTSVKCETKLSENEESCKPATQLTNLSQKESYDNNMENAHVDDDCKDNSHSRICEHSLTPRKRKGSDSVSFSMRLRSKKVQEVVLLDGDARHSESAERTSTPWDAMKIYYPSRDHPNSVELSHDNIKCLEPESLVSSPIINFYIMYLQGPMSSISRPRGNYHIFNTYFFSKLEALTSKADKAAYFLKLRRWWKGVDIFQKAYIVFPVHADTHWSLVIICMPAKGDQSGPIILHLDSLKFHSSRYVFSIVDSFLKQEWNYLKENGSLEGFHLHETVWKNLPRKIVKKPIAVPQQDNDYDCGLFVLYYIQRFLEDAPERLHKKDFCMFGKGWFQPEEASALRKTMHSLLVQLFEEAKSNNDMTEPTTPEHRLQSTSTKLGTPEQPLEVSSTEAASDKPATPGQPMEVSATETASAKPETPEQPKEVSSTEAASTKPATPEQPLEVSSTEAAPSKHPLEVSSTETATSERPLICC